MTHYDVLYQNLIDVILESQIKIGYTDNPVRLYYPQATLCAMLGVDTDYAGMEALLDGLPSAPLGRISISRSHDRWCLTVPASGVRYVYEHVRDTGFLTAFIELLRSHAHGLGIEEILSVFRRFSDHVVCREVQDDEFDYLVYFEDGKPDRYRYLISMEMGHASYHRFTPEDYAALGFSE